MRPCLVATATHGTDTVTIAATGGGGGGARRGETTVAGGSGVVFLVYPDNFLRQLFQQELHLQLLLLEAIKLLKSQRLAHLTQ